MSARTRNHRRLALVASIALAVVAGCSTGSDDSTDGDSTVATVATEVTTGSDVTTAPEASSTTAVDLVPVIRIDIPPGTADDFEGAREDVTEEFCTRQDLGWVTEGTVVNSTDTVVDYRVYTTFNDDTGELRALLQTDVRDVLPGAEGTWGNVVDIPDENLTCILRVERIAK